MNKQLTEIAFILDRSGSMEPITEQTVRGFNDFLSDQQSLQGQARLTLVLFDDKYEVPIDAMPVSEITPIDSRTYFTRGMTALLDAIGRTVDGLGKRLAKLPEKERPGKVIIAILTDGLENASEFYKLKEINGMIRHQQEKFSWEFLFLGANQDAIATAATMGIAAHHAATMEDSEDGHHAAHVTLSQKASAMRNYSMGVAGEDEMARLRSPSSQLYQEELKRKRRKSRFKRKDQSSQS